MPSRNYDGIADVESFNLERFRKMEEEQKNNDRSNRFEPLVIKAAVPGGDFCGDSITELQDKIAAIIRDNTLPNDFGRYNLKEEDILTIAKEIEKLVNTENKGIDHAMRTLRDQAKNNEA